MFISKDNISSSLDSIEEDKQIIKETTGNSIDKSRSIYNDENVKGERNSSCGSKMDDIPKEIIKPPLEVPAWSIAIFAIVAIGDVAYICYGFYRAFHLDSWWYLFLLVPFSIPNLLILPLYTRSEKMCFRPLGRFIYTFPFGVVVYFLMNFVFCSPILLFWFIPTGIDLGQVLFSIMIGTTILIYIYSLIVALLLPKEYTYKINLNARGKNENNARLNKMTLIHLSDLHLGTSVGERSGKRVVNKIFKIVKRESKKRRVAVVVTGDISDMDNYSFEHSGIKIWKYMLEKFDSLDTKDDLVNSRKRVQTFAILGNHDLYATEEMAELLKPAILLDSDNNGVGCGYYNLDIDGNNIQLYGINNDRLLNFPKEDKLSSSSDSDQDQIVVKEQPYIPKILLEHQPVRRIGYDLILAGHTHGGQLLHFGLITKIAFPIFIGHYFRYGAHYIVSRGTCWWGPRLRWLRSEIGVIKLKWKT